MDWSDRESEAGFSLIELLVVIVLASIMSTLAITSYRAYNRSQDHRGATREVVAILRNAQVRAVSEATTYQCIFTSSELEIYRDGAIPPAAANKVRTFTLTEQRFRGNLRFLAASPNGFVHPDGTKKPNCLFFARGSATTGFVEVERVDNNETHSANLEGLTARVSYED